MEAVIGTLIVGTFVYLAWCVALGLDAFISGDIDGHIDAKWESRGWYTNDIRENDAYRGVRKAIYDWAYQRGAQTYYRKQKLREENLARWKENK